MRSPALLVARSAKEEPALFTLAHPTWSLARVRVAAETSRVVPAFNVSVPVSKDVFPLRVISLAAPSSTLKISASSLPRTEKYESPPSRSIKKLASVAVSAI